MASSGAIRRGEARPAPPGQPDRGRILVDFAGPKAHADGLKRT
jgi:hypothetical protein